MKSERFIFSPARGFILSPLSASIIVRTRPGSVISVPVDLGYSRLKSMVEGDRAVFIWGDRTVAVNVKSIGKIVDSDKLVFVGENGSYVLEIRDSGNYYKLKYLGERVPPTLEINGVHMHNISGTDPLRDAERKVRLLGVKRGDVVLDICTGLGYTAISSLERGAEVVSIEKDSNVLLLAEHNPFSRKLEDVEIVLGDAYRVIEEFEKESFDKILHDPPVFAFAGELYSKTFYLKLFNVLRRNGRLFHYTGAPGKHRGFNLQRGVARRLREAGFRIERIIEGYGVIAAKR